MRLNIIRYHDISNQKLYTLPNIPYGVTHLNFSNNYISSITADQLPSTLIEIIGNNNNLYQIEDLTKCSQLKTVNLNNNELCYISSLPDSLIHLYINKNLISVINKLPPYLYEFDCSHNVLEYLPNMSSTLNTLKCNNNYITHLPKLNHTSLENLDCSNNNLQFIPELSSSVKMYCVDNNNNLNKEFYKLDRVNEYWHVTQFIHKSIRCVDGL